MVRLEKAFQRRSWSKACFAQGWHRGYQQRELLVSLKNRATSFHHYGYKACFHSCHVFLPSPSLPSITDFLLLS